ncbi:universal stress protein [Lysobacter sp. TY2-98]|uniref:universal stress protein n=1 Tax=Lysobacter sp. TY2-98 TaxID=2290922 RepID=UPI000E201E8D|nr:universal stress protein [Lysobacter sp. TY2-98]AXK71047.1 universal stress protein [Lysobacter sp. TY2-98]
MIRDILLALTDTASDEVALEAAVSLAQSTDARLTVAVPLDRPLATVASYGVTPVVLEQSLTLQRDTAEARAVRFRETLKSRDIVFDVHVAEAHTAAVPHLLALEARYADLVVVAAAGPKTADTPALHAAFATLLFESGRPVLTIPHDGDVRFPIRRAAVAWRPTPEAARAVHDALPLLPKGAHVDVLVIEPMLGDRDHGQEPGADIAAHLARHGLEVSVQVHPTARGGVGNDLLLTAVESRSDLIICGGYGHSRAREWAFGGATRELLWRSHVPVLFSH